MNALTPKTEQERKATFLQTLQLKIKHLSIADEARLIRRHENSMRKHRKVENPEWLKALNEQIQIQPDSDLAMKNLKGIREYLYIPNRRHHPDERASLQIHRHELREELRAIHLARGYLKGMPYRVMEQIAFDSPKWHRVWYHVVKFSKIEDSVKARQEFATWADAGVPLVTKHNQMKDYTTQTRWVPSRFISSHLAHFMPLKLTP